MYTEEKQFSHGDKVYNPSIDRYGIFVADGPDDDNFYIVIQEGIPLYWYKRNTRHVEKNDVQDG